MMYAIVDIETTGGYAANHRITEIAIYLHDGEKIIDSYQTLINPEQSIPEYITGLTGISNQTVANSPTFEEVSDEIYKWLDGKIFVAHNVHFDYSFLKKEFEQLGVSISHKRLCTVRLSRKLIPGLSSYGLGNLSKSLGVKIMDRHRAGGDAEATATIFHHLLKRDKDNFIQEYLKRNSKETLLPPHLPKEEFEELPEETGVYYFLDQHGKVIYVGKATNIKKRITGHFSGNKGTWGNSNIKKEIHHISYELTGNDLIALLHENEEIKKLWPKYNQAQKHFTSKWGIYSYEDQNGYIRFNINKVKRGMKPVIAMFTHSDIWHFLIAQTRDFELCPKLTGIQNVHEACYDYQNGNCHGACAGKEDAGKYNSRVQQFLDSLLSDGMSYALIGKGRQEGELSFAMVEKNKYRGIGFFDQDLTISQLSDLEDFLHPHLENPYSLQVIQSFCYREGYEMISDESPGQLKD